MNPSDFTHTLQNAQNINHKQVDDVKSIIDKYPYFQSARAIYLKALKNQNSLKYNQELKTTAAYTTDRSILFDFITSEAFVQNEISQVIKQNTSHLKTFNVDIEDLSIKKSVTIDDALKQQIKDTDGVLDPTLFQPKYARPTKSFILDESETIEHLSPNAKTQDTEASPQEILNLGKPLQFNKRESHSFNEWLKLTKFKPIKRHIEHNKDTSNYPVIEDISEKEKKFKLIDKFIAQNPKISPAKPLSQKGNLAKAQMIQTESLMTETLARIYLEQKNYKKAIQSYKILSLKYPEKSSFFANQIKAVEQLQEQNNKE